MTARTKEVAFVKYSAAGNDFIVIDGREEAVAPADAANTARALCHRGSSVGADGLLLMSFEQGRPRMRLWNADGSTAEFSGNAARCAVRYVVDAGWADSGDNNEAQVTLLTDIGTVHGRVGGHRVHVEIPGGATVVPDLRIRVEGRDLLGTYVLVGVPFFVVLHDNPDDLPVRYLGKAIRNHADLQPAGANVDFVRVDDEQNLYFRVYERGVEAETLSSGTGSISAALAAAARDRVSSPVACHARGGVLTVSFRRADDGPGGTSGPVADGGGISDAHGSGETALSEADFVRAPEPPSLLGDAQRLRYADIAIDGNTRRVMSGTAHAEALLRRSRG